MSEKTTLGSLIQAKRKEKGMSQAKLAKATGVSQNAIYKWENDETMPKYDKLLTLMSALGCTAEEALSISENWGEAKNISALHIEYKGKTFVDPDVWRDLNTLFDETEYVSKTMDKTLNSAGRSRVVEYTEMISKENKFRKDAALDPESEEG